MSFTYCDIHENFWALQVVVKVEVAVSLDAALGELHAELGAIAQARDGETKRLVEVVTAWLKKCSCLSKEKNYKNPVGPLDFLPLQLRILANF